MKYIVKVRTSNEYEVFHEEYSGIEHDTRESAEAEAEEAGKEEGIDYAYVEEIEGR